MTPYNLILLILLLPVAFALIAWMGVMRTWQLLLLCALAVAGVFLASLPGDPWGRLPFLPAPYHEPPLYERTAP